MTVLDLYGQGKLDEESLGQLNRRLRRRQDAIREQLATLEAPLEVDFSVNQEKLRLPGRHGPVDASKATWSRRKTLLREVYNEIRIWPKTATKPWTRKLFVAANLDALNRFWMVSPTGHVSSALLVRTYLLLRAYATLNVQPRGRWRVTTSI